MSATIHDVARVAGVSIKTVSRVLNGESNVAAATAALVHQAIAELDYHPNHAARALRTGASDTIGVIVDSLSDPFFAKLISVFEDRATAAGMDVVVASTGADEDRARMQMTRMVRRNVRGLLVAPFGPSLAALPEPGVVPTVLIDRHVEGSPYDEVIVDDEAAALTAVTHLLEHGHTKIGFLGESLRFSTVHDRLKGYRRALDAHAVSLTPEYVHTACWDSDTAMRLTKAMLGLEDAPTAIFASTPITGIGVLSGLRAIGRSDVAVVVFGDFPLSTVLEPAITVVDQVPLDLANTAMDRLLARLGGDTSAPTSTVVATQFIVRGSGELPPAGDR
jgi:LacI family transcriptional regulator